MATDILPDLPALLAALPPTRIGVIGDFFLDIYWEHDLSVAEQSLETGLPTRPVRHQRYQLGAAGTIVNNLVAMGVGQVSIFGVVGNDPFGRELQRLVDQPAIDPRGLIVEETDWDTLVYLKPIRDGREEQRIDFGNFNRLADTTATALVEQLAAALDTLDVVIVNQQVPFGIHTARFRARFTELIKRHAEHTFIVDCRQVAGAYPGCWQRVNEIEATRLCGLDRDPDRPVAAADARAAAEQLFARSGKPVFVSRGQRGVIVADHAGSHAVPGLHLPGPVDPVGAGDSMLAGIAAATAAGRSPREAAIFGNFSAAVTTRKLFQTGRATPAEILAIGTDPDYAAEP